MILVSLLYILRGKPNEPQPLQPCGVRTVKPDGWDNLTDHEKFNIVHENLVATWNR